MAVERFAVRRAALRPINANNSVGLGLREKFGVGLQASFLGESMVEFLKRR